MMFRAEDQNVAPDEVTVDRTVGASGLARTSLHLAGVFVLSPTSV
jgi:hypothetical protein